MKSMKKVLAVILSVVTLMTAIPLSSISTYASEVDAYGKVTSITDKLTVSEDSSALVTVSNGGRITLLWSKADEEIGRTQDGWWAGIKMTAPSKLSIEELKKSTYGSFAYGAQSWSDGKNFWEKQDSDKSDESEETERFITLWSFVNQEKIKQAKENHDGIITTQWHFDWDADSSYEQSVVVELDVENLVLKKDETQVYPFDTYGKVETITDKGNVKNSGTSKVEVLYDKGAALTWSAKDTDIFRNKDGWWVGIKLTAPDIGNDILKDAKFQSLAYGSANPVTGKSFWEKKDSDETIDKEQYITLWAYVNEELLNSAILNNENVVTEWEFDWNNDKLNDQTVSIKINPEEVVLNDKSGKKVYPSQSSANVEAITEADRMVVEHNESNIVTVSNEDEITIQWSQADKEIGRMQDGWWAGIKIIAPEGFSADKAQYKVLYNGQNKWANKSFQQCKDDDNYITMWAFVDENALENPSVVNKYQFDWDGDGVYEQYIIFSLDTSKIVLDPTNWYKMDKEKPVIPDIKGSEEYSKDSVTVNFTVEEKGTESNGQTYISGIKDVYYSVKEFDNPTEKDLENFASVAMNNETGEYNFTVSDDFGGTYYIYAVDKAGNIGTNSVVVKVDKTAPEFGETNVDLEDLSKTWTNDEIVITGNVSDALSGITDEGNFSFAFTDKNKENVEVEYKFEYNSTTENSGEYTLIISQQTFCGDITLICSDNAGVPQTIIFSVLMDKDNCKVISIKPDADDWVNRGVNIEVEVTDETSGVKEVSAELYDESGVLVKEQPSVTCGKENACYNISIPNPKQNIDGECFISFEDKAGNKFTTENGISVKIDVYKPVVDTAEPIKSGWTNLDVTVNGKVSDIGDAQSKVAAVCYVEGDGFTDDELTLENLLENTFPVDTFNAETGEYKFTIEKQNYEGNYTIYCIDNAGNISEGKKVGVQMDIEKPFDLTVIFPKNEPTLRTTLEKMLSAITFGFYKPSVEVTISAKDREANGVASGIQYFNYKIIDPITGKTIKDGKEEAEKSSAEISIKDDGYYIVEFTAFDWAGNSSSYSSLDNEDILQGAVVDNFPPRIASVNVNKPNLFINPDNYDENVILNDSSSIDLISDYLGYELYYDSDVEATISINEANFGSLLEYDKLNEEKHITVSVNGVACEGLVWTNETNSDGKKTDVYATAIKLTGDGKYNISVNCTDLSGNVMDTYTSQSIIIDKYAPMITGFSFETEGSYFHKDKENEKLVDNSSSTKPYKDNYDYYFENDFTVTVKASDVLDGLNSEDSASGIKDIILIAQDVNNGWVTVTDNDDLSPNQKFDNQKSFKISGPFKGNLYAIAVDRLGHYPTESNIGWNTVTDNIFYEYKLDDEGKSIIPEEAPIIAIGALFVAPYDSIIENNGKHMEESDITISINAKASEIERPKDSDVNNRWIDEVTNGITQDKTPDFIRAQHVDLFKNDVNVTLSVEDKYSGIRQVEWYVKGRDDQDSVNNQSGKLVIDNDGKTVEGTNKANDTDWRFDKNETNNLVLNASKDIKVTNNSNDIIILVILTDRAGNKSYDYRVIGIDKTVPEISVEYSDLNQRTGEYDNYYNHARTATIKVKERNFDAKYINAVVKNIDSVYDYVPNISNIINTNAWTCEGISDNKTYSYKVYYAKDGQYQFDMDLTDVAGNKSSRSERAFTIDLTAPKISVSLDKNDIVKNSKYFNETRTAAITVTEHNFNPSQFENLIKAALNGNNISVPQVTGFTRNSSRSDMWTATVTFSVDGDYVLGFKYTDMAGNSYAAVSGDFSGTAALDFTIDKTAPEISIDVNDKYSYITGPVVRVTEKDNNCSDITSSMVGVVWNNDIGNMDNMNVLSSDQKLNEDHHNADFVVSYEKIAADGYYTVNAKCVDMAGNESVTAVKVFTKNEYGAVYVPSHDLSNLSYANKDNLTDKQLYFDEYSPTPINASENEYYININGKMKEGFISREMIAENNGWYHYRYTLNNDKLTAEGLYDIFVRTGSTLKDGNIVNNDPSYEGEHRFKKSFVIDNTNPYVRISGLEKHIYRNVTSQDVKLTVSDNNLYKIKVTVNDDIYIWVSDADKYTLLSNEIGANVKSFVFAENDKSLVTADFTLNLGASDISIEVSDLAGNYCCNANDYNKDELFLDASQRLNSIFDYDSNGNTYIRLTSVTITDNWFEALPQMIKDNQPMAIAIFAGIAVVLCIVIIVPILIKRRKKLDDSDRTEME